MYTPNTNPMTKHVGFHNDKKCVVILQLPEEPGMVHIVDTESLPQQIHQNLMDIVQLPEAQNVHWLGDVLSRRMFADGSNALRTLYERQHVTQVPVGQVVLSPRPNMIIPLTEVLPYLNNTSVNPLAAQQIPSAAVDAHTDIMAAEQAKLDAGPQEIPIVEEAAPVPVNQHAVNLESDKIVANKGIADGLIQTAQMLEAEAMKKRAEAARMLGQTNPYAAAFAPAAPVAAPVAPPVPEIVPVVVEAPVTTFVDPVTNKSYKSESALKGAITRRTKAANG